MLENLLRERDYPQIIRQIPDVTDVTAPPYDLKLLEARYKTLRQIQEREGILLAYPGQEVIIPTLIVGAAIIRELGHDLIKDPIRFFPDISEDSDISDIPRGLFPKGFLLSEPKEVDPDTKKYKMLGLVVPTFFTGETTSPFNVSSSTNSLFVITGSAFTNSSKRYGRDAFFRIQNFADAIKTRYYEKFILLDIDTLGNSYLATEAYRF